MTKPKHIFIIAFAVCLLSLTNSFAQTETKQSETSYEVVLQVLTASSNQTDKSVILSPLSNVVKKLKTIYSFSNYRLDSTYLQRISNKGNVEVRSVSNEAGQNQENNSYIFTDWTFGGMQGLPNSRGQNIIQFETFRFGQRVPIRTSNGGVNYEQIGLKLQNIELPENVPTVVGSLTMAKSDELTFLVLTVRPTE